MRTIVVLLLVVGTSLSFAAKKTDPCAALTALRGLVLPPPPPALIREVLNALVPGRPSGAVMAKLRRATWPEGLPLPRLRRSVGQWEGSYSELPTAPTVTVRIPQGLLGTAVEVATVMHEHQHGRIAQALPEVLEADDALRAKLDAYPESKLSIDRAAMVGEFQWLHEWHAMSAEYAIYRMLTVAERRALRELVLALPKGLHPWDKENLGAGLRVNYRTVNNYLRSQYETDRYNEFECLTDALLPLFDMRDETDFDEAADMAIRHLQRKRVAKAED